ncbi:hypothetical protein EC900091_4339, partial [Escherichia coli 90.0091]
MNKFF